MSEIEESKKRLSEVFNRLEALIEKKITSRSNVSEASTENDEMLTKVNQSLLEQNTVLQKKLFDLENKYHEIKNINKDTSIQIDEVVSNLKNLVKS